VRGSHRCSGNGVGGILAADPSRENVQARGEDVVAFAEVGEVSTLIGQLQKSLALDLAEVELCRHTLLAPTVTAFSAEAGE